MSNFEDAIHQLPKPILDKLKAMISRVRRLLFVRGLFATLAVGLLCLLVIMAIDASVTIFSSAARWLLSLSALAVTILAGWWYLVRPLSRKFTLTKIARILEVRHPELQERISTAVELKSSNDPDSIKGSEELIQAVVDDAVIDIESVNPKHEFKPARANKFILASIIFAAVLGLLLAVFPTQGFTLLTRALAPFLDVGNAYANTMVINPGDIRLAKGEPLTIEMTIDHKRLSRAEIRIKQPNGKESVERMMLTGKTADGRQHFTSSFPQVDESFQYRIRAGSALSEYYDVEAIEPPQIEKLQIRYDFPDYTQREPLIEENSTGEIRAVTHTQVTVTATANKPVTKAKAKLNERAELG
ncbi:MAG: hypothetical protein AAF226_18835, partial [Verrucomicrobiota bacterium]